MASKVITVLLKALTGAYRAEMTKSTAKTTALAAAAGNTGRATQALTRVLGPTGVAAAKVAAGFGLAGGVAFALGATTKAAIRFESDMAGVAKTLEDSRFGAKATAVELEAIGFGIRRMATEIPASTTAIAEVAEAAGQLGIQKGRVLEFTEVMINLGNTTNLSADEAATALARLANITQMPQTQFEQLGSTIVHLGNNFATTEQEITEMALRIAGAGNLVGLSEDEILSFATALSSVGVKAEAGGSAISRVFLEIQDSVHSGGAELDKFAEVAGMTSQAFQKMFEDDPDQAIKAFVEGLQRIRLEGGNVNATLRDVGLSEIRVRDALLRLAGAGSLLERSLETGSQAWKENSALAEEAAKRYETTASRLELAKNNIKDLGIEMGNTLLPVVGGAADKTTVFMKAMRGANQEIEGFGERVAYLAGRGVFYVMPEGMQRTATEANNAADNMALLENGLLGATQGLEALTIRLGGSNEAQMRWQVGADGVLRAVKQEKSTLDQINPSLKLMFEHTGEANRANAGLAGTTGELNERMGITGEIVGDTEAELEAMIDTLKGVFDAQADVIAGIQGWLDPLETYNSMLEEKNEAERASAEATAASTKGQSDSWEDHFTEVEQSFGLYMKALDQHLEDQRAWHKNLQRIREVAGDEYADYLTAQGPAQADLVAEIAKQSEAKIQKAADKQLQIWIENGDAVLSQIEFAGEDFVDSTGEFSDEVVDALAEHLGVSPSIVRAIFEDSRSEAGEKMLEMKGLVRLESGRVVDEMNMELGVANTVARDRFRDVRDRVEEGMDATADVGEKGANKVVTRIARELRLGADEVARISNSYARMLADGLNPVIRSVNGTPIVVSRGQLGQAGLSGQNRRAEGGIDDPRPNAHITNQMSILYGEPETGGEAYIPLSPAKRPRSRMIASETVKRLGGNVEWMATGGFKSVGAVPKVPSVDPGEVGFTGKVAMRHTRDAAVKWLKENLAPELGSGVGWKAMWKALSTRFPGASLLSAFRAGAVTRSGNASYHSMGRAVDVSPWVSIAQWIRDNYMAKTREMIFTRFGNRQIHNGRNHYYADPGIRADHIGHVHWAMDKGGMVKPGYMRYLNRLRRRLRHNRPIHEDFSFPGMGRFADRYHEQLADKFYASHRGFNFDNSARTRKTLASFLAGPARNYRFADGTMIADEVVRALKPVLGPPGVDADTDKSGVPIHRYDTGGFLPQGLSMAYNGTGAPEPVGMGGLAGATIVIDAGLAAPIRGEIKRVLRQGAREHAQAVRAGGG